MPKGDKVTKDKAENGRGYKIKSKGKSHKGHAIEITDTYIVIHDAVTREHIKIVFADIDGDGNLEEVEATWLT
jgi:hypothetical protein